MRNKTAYLLNRSGIQRFFKIIFCVFVFSNGLYAQPPAPVAFITLSGSPLLCETDQGTVTFNIPVGQNPYNLLYRVDGGATQTVTTTNPSVNVSISTETPSTPTTPGTEDVRVIELIGITDANYPTPQTITGQTATLTFQPKPFSTLSVTGFPSSICPDGGSVTLNASDVNYANGTILWEANGSGPQNGLTNANSTSPSFTSVVADGGNLITLQMKVQSNNICASSQTPTAAQSTTRTYTIQVRPAINTTQELLPGTGNKFCQYDPTAQLKFTASQGTAPYTFTYTKDGNEETVQTIPTNSVSIKGGLTQEASVVNNYTLIKVQDANCTQNIVKPIITITVNPLPAASMLGNHKICKDDPNPTIDIKIDAATKAPYTVNYKVDGEDASITMSALSSSIEQSTSEPGLFTYSLVSVKDSNQCEAKINSKKASVSIRERPNARFSIDKNRTSILEPEIKITDLSIATDLWYWDFGDSTAQIFGSNPGSHVYADTGTFKITLIAANSGCGDTTSLPVRVYMPYSMFIPSAFSPNGDGVNDIFSPKGEGFLKYEMSIYDRWGNQIFQTTDINKGWDGKVSGGDVVPMGICVYVINIIALDKKSYSYSGTVSSIPK